jgi:hypothetical protein
VLVVEIRDEHKELVFEGRLVLEMARRRNLRLHDYFLPVLPLGLSQLLILSGAAESVFCL